MPKLSDVISDINTDYGSPLVKTGVHWSEHGRIPTGWFPFDLATGGGFPMGGISLVYGPESSLKTSLAMRAVGQCQMIYPDLKCVLLDLEAAYDPAWGEKLGVDNDKLIYSIPGYAEQAIDICVAMLQAEDVGAIVVDSIAAMAPENELTSSAEKASVGGASLLVGKFYRKVTNVIGRQADLDRFPLLLCINQTRFKVGVMYGNPETMPGGMALKFGSKMTVRLYGKDKDDAKIHSSMPAWKEVNGEIKKFKCPITSKSFKFNMGAVNVPKKGVMQGQVDSWNTVSTYLKKYGWLGQTKPGKPWVLMGEHEFKTLKECRAFVEADPDLRRDLEQRIIKRAMDMEAIDDEED